ncbi:hypothetical protein [Methanoplanus limicola]|uniref:Uncharacterized protein n=1 Tax=Methanoplanus limicola DSM 2279 TaxID=937775 RepID=H1YZC5_9EURY|nr:hypothetical protein [Methanoplanus limicola]EHQ35149.1 hypothetical protein Metlim_1030 [Methanoplanus limicola DSM 2279]
MMSKKLLMVVLCFTAVILAIVGMTAAFFFGQGIGGFGTDNPKNQELVCEVVGYTDAVEARLSADDPLPDYITEKYGEIRVPPDVKTYDLAEFRDFGLNQDNSTSLITRIYDTEYDLNYNFIDSSINKKNMSADTYSAIIYYINDSESAVALLAEGTDLSKKDENGLSFFILNINFQSESGDNYGIYIKPVQATESAVKSKSPLYIIYSSKDIDHNYMPPLPAI